MLLEPGLPDGRALVEQGKALASDWKVEPGAFLKHVGCHCEAEYKRKAAAAGRIMQHAQIGFRDLEKSKRAWAEIYESCQRKGITVDRYGICLDWSFGYTREQRQGRPIGTGLMLEGIEDFVALTAMAPVAPHFGDFVIGFPGSLENTKAALASGSTSIGNLGQYFTFRLPNIDEDIETTRATVLALALIAGQEQEVLVHSNLDDGFASLFTDLASSIGAVLLEKHVIEELIGAPLTHCYGNHFSDPLRRMAFHIALTKVSSHPGTMVYGNTTGYRGNDAQNFASLASYLLTDILAQRLRPSGHAINPVPVTENSRIPDIDEVISAQLFAGRLVEHAGDYIGLIDLARAEAMADRMIEAGSRFRDNVLSGLAEQGVDTGDAFQMLLAIRRTGGKRLEQRYGVGAEDPAVLRGRRPVIPGSLIDEINHMAATHMQGVGTDARKRLAEAGLSVMVATTDVHEHGKLLVETVLRDLGVRVLEGGVSTDADDLAEAAGKAGADAIALSTYNGVALDYVQKLKAELKARGFSIPVLVGGRLNQVPKGSNTSLPVEVTAELKAEGALVCSAVEDAVPALLNVLAARDAKPQRPTRAAE
jgi:methylmalonyl-CoA mutase cobalamin-binding subunit